MFEKFLSEFSAGWRFFIWRTPEDYLKILALTLLAWFSDFWFLGLSLNIWMTYINYGTITWNSPSSSDLKFLLALQEYSLWAYLITTHSLLTHYFLGSIYILLNIMITGYLLTLTIYRKITTKQAVISICAILKFTVIYWLNSEEYLQVPYYINLILWPFECIYLLVFPKLLIFTGHHNAAWDLFQKYWVFYLGYIFSLFLCSLIGWDLGASICLVALANHIHSTKLRGQEIISNDPADFLEPVLLLICRKIGLSWRRRKLD